MDLKIEQDSFVEEVYHISENVDLVFEQDSVYLMIDDIYFPISALRDNYNETDKELEISNNHEIKSLSVDDLDTIFDVFKIKKFNI